MKLFLLTSFGMMMAMSVAGPKIPLGGLDAALQKLQELAALRAELMNELNAQWGSEDELDGDRQPVCVKPVAGLQSGSLRVVSVQSGARGLTPEDEWRRMFPHKPGYSR
jgi:hypothetical protein